MLTYMLDTNICIYVMKTYPPAVRENFNALADQLCISSITLGELHYGAEKSARRSENLTAIEHFGARLDVLPSASAISAKKVSALTKALNRKEERQEAADNLRSLIERISLTPGPERGEIYATLYGELGTILNWTERQAIGKAAKTTKPAAAATGVSLSVVAGVRLGFGLLFKAPDLTNAA